MLLLWITTTNAMAEDMSSLYILLKGGNKVQFILPVQKPMVTCAKGTMYVYYDDYTQIMSFERDEVDYLEVKQADLTAIDKAEINEPDIRFDLTHKGVVSIYGLQAKDRIHVYSLDGKSVDATITRHESEATVDLSQQRRGIYMVSVNNSFTFKLMKP